MKHLASLTLLLATLSLAAPATGWSRDRHHNYCDVRSSARYCPPSVSFRSYRSPGYYSPSYYAPSYYAPSYYSPYPYGYSDYEYARPSVGISFSSGPGYASYSRPLRTSSDSDDLAEDVQRALARRGYYRGQIDGEIGAGTRGAIREFQYRNNLEVSGRIDRSLLRSLGLS